MGKRMRRFLMGLATVCGFRRRGFFIPYRYAATVPGPDARPPYGEIEKTFDERRDVFAEFLRQVDGFANDLKRIGADAPPMPRWNQDWFPRLDGAAAYGMVRTLQPARVVEVGSGHSTRFLARAVGDGGLSTRITAIDPAPRADLSNLDVAIIRTTVQAAGPVVFSELESGDFLIIDSSHIAMPGSDVDMLLNRVLPALPTGVVVHIHDIFLPDDYPPEWNWRGYNEQLAVAPLIHGGAYEVLFASRYVATRMEDALAKTVIADLPLSPGAFESSLWLRKTKDHGVPIR
jgi:predicted O-methyltransferase YrrM